jgi:MOSC domain-containing protein YiiM
MIQVGPYLYQINISDGGVPKLPVSQALVTFEGVAGDRQRNTDIHGGKERAVCLYSLEIIHALLAEGHSIMPGSSGENFTIAHLDWAMVKPGDRLAVGPTLRLEIVSYTAPCRWNARWFSDGDFNRMSQRRHPGWSRLYARVLTEGVVHAGDAVTVERREAPSGEGER